MIIGATPYAFLIGSFLAKKETYAISIPVFAAVGIGGAVLWAAEGVYLGKTDDERILTLSAYIEIWICMCLVFLQADVLSTMRE